MSNPFESDAGSELFGNYDAELNLVKADLNQKLDQIAEASGEERKKAIRGAERALEEATELLDQMKLEKTNIPANSQTRNKANQTHRNHQTDIDTISRKLKAMSSDRAQLFGDRYADDPEAGPRDAHLEQRQQLLSGTERLGRSGERLTNAHAMALETENIGAQTLADLHGQRNTIENTHSNLLQSEGYVDRSVKTLRGMARRMATNRIITIAIITVLVLLIFGVIYSKFR